MAITHVIAGPAVALVLTALATSGAVAEELSLSQAVAIALRNNPTISAGQLTAVAAQDSAKGARALANPQFEVAPTIIGEAGSDSAILVSQPLEINGSRRVRSRIAEDQACVASYEAETSTRKVVLEVKEAYWNLAAAQAMLRLNRENADYLSDVHNATKKQFDIGAVPGSQLIKSEVELARARQETALAELDFAQSKTLLAALMNRPCDEKFTASDPLAYRQTVVSLDALLGSAQKTRPEIAAAQYELAAARGRTRAARIAREPDLSIQARRGSLDGSEDQGVAIGINLPIFDWGSAKAEQRSAATAARAQEKRLDAARNAANLDVRQAAEQVITSAGIVREYQGGIVEKSEQLALMARTGFEKGATSYLELLEAQRTLRLVRTDYLTALANHSKSLARLEWASGCGITTTAEEIK